MLPNIPPATLDRGVNLIARKEYFFKMEAVKRMLNGVGNLQLARTSSKEGLDNFGSMIFRLGETLAKLETMRAKLDSLGFCPAVHDSLKIARVDSSAVHSV